MRQSAWVFLILAGCVPLQPVGDGRDAVLTLVPRFAQQTQAVVSPLTVSSIATLDIVPYVQDSGLYKPISLLTGNPTTIDAVDVLKLTQASPSIETNRPFVLRRLKPNKNYRVYARAYGVGNSQISQDGTSYVDVAMGNDDAPVMATIPVYLLPTAFAASTSVTVNTEGRFDYLKGTLYLLPGNTQVSMTQSTRKSPDFTFLGLQANTNYRLVAEAYKRGVVIASTSLDLNIGTDNAPASQSLSLNVPYVVTTLIGPAGAGFNDGPGSVAKVNFPIGVAADYQGNVYVADDGNHRIRKIAPDGVVSTLAGNGNQALLNGTGTAASFWNPSGVVADSQGNVYVADAGNHCIRKVTSSGVVTTFAGNGTAGLLDGVGLNAKLNHPVGLTFDSQGNLYVADSYNHAVRKIQANGTVTTVTGNGTPGSANGVGTSATYDQPWAVAFDTAGNLFITDRYNHLIRKMTTGGVVTKFAGIGAGGFADGTGASAVFSQPIGLVSDAQDNLYVADAANCRIRKVTPQAVVTTLVGNGAVESVDGTGLSARVSHPHGLGIDPQGVLYIGDYNWSYIRKMQ